MLCILKQFYILPTYIPYIYGWEYYYVNVEVSVATDDVDDDMVLSTLNFIGYIP